ncbi:MAG: nucleotidyltransferase family protein, partial [Chloroflexota bacterium]
MALNPKEILLICLGHNSLEKKNKLLASLPGNEWQKVIDLAKEQFILPFLYYQIKNVQADIPAETLSQLRGLLMETAATNLSLYHGINSLLNSLHAKGIPVIVLKGGYLAEAVYENVGLRTMSDIDLLVKEADLPAVDNELISKGYRPKEFNRVIGPEHQHFGYTLPGRNLFVEVHWTIMPPVYKFIIDMPELWKRAVPVTLGAAPAFSLGLEDVILHLCLHTAKHAAEMGIRMLVDIDVLLKRYQEKVNWTFLVETAREWKAEHAVYLVLRLSRDMLDAAVPDPVIKDLKPKEDVANYFTIAQKELLS